MEQRGISARLLKGGNDRGETCRGGIHAAREHDKGAPVGGIGQGGCVRRQLTGADEQDLGILQGAAAREKIVDDGLQVGRIGGKVADIGRQMELVPFRRRIQHDAGTFGNAFGCGFLLLGTGQDGQHGG